LVERSAVEVEYVFCWCKPKNLKDNRMVPGSSPGGGV